MEVGELDRHVDSGHRRYAAVPDVAAADLMCALHDRLAGGATLAHALFDAREGLDRADPAAFVNWCTFSAYGAA